MVWSLSVLLLAFALKGFTHKAAGVWLVSAKACPHAVGPAHCTSWVQPAPRSLTDSAWGHQVPSDRCAQHGWAVRVLTSEMLNPPEESLRECLYFHSVKLGCSFSKKAKATKAKATTLTIYNTYTQRPSALALHLTLYIIA